MVLMKEIFLISKKEGMRNNMLLKSIRKKVLFGLFKLFPLKTDTVVFKSFEGQYNDNPKYISEKLHEIRPDIKIVWGITKKSSGSDIPLYVKKCDINSVAFSKISATAIVVIDNMSGMQGIKGKKYIRILDYFIKRRNQLNLSTWHGTPLKKIGCDIPSYNISNYQSSTTYITAGNKYSYDIFKHAFHGIDIVKYGAARNDILVNGGIDTNAIKRKLNLPVEKKILLYAPTFRENEYDSGISQIKSIDLDKMFEMLGKRFGGEWVIVLRVHHRVLMKLRSECGEVVDNKIVYDGNAYDDMAEYLLCADALLTDYSSSMFDYMLTGKPCFLYAHDRDRYVNDERGVYMGIDKLPYPFADSVKQLYDNVAEYDSALTNMKEKEFLDKIGNADDGQASLRVVKDILYFIDETKKGIKAKTVKKNIISGNHSMIER